MSAGLWFASRATGLVALLLLSATVVLGALTTGRYASLRWPRFAVLALHRNLSLVAVAFLAVHILSAVIDGYVSIGWLDVLVPFGSSYQPFWLGLGALASDLLIAVLVSSLLRARVPLRAWRAIHCTVYAMFPLAVVHAVGIGGADSRLGWVIGCLGVGVAAVLGSTWLRRRGSTHADSRAREYAQERLVNP